MIYSMYVKPKAHEPNLARLIILSGPGELSIKYGYFKIKVCRRESTLRCVRCYDSKPIPILIAEHVVQ